LDPPIHTRGKTGCTVWRLNGFTQHKHTAHGTCNSTQHQAVHSTAAFPSSSAFPGTPFGKAHLGGSPKGQDNSASRAAKLNHGASLCSLLRADAPLVLVITHTSVRLGGKGHPPGSNCWGPTSTVLTFDLPLLPRFSSSRYWRLPEKATIRGAPHSPQVQPAKVGVQII